MKAGVSRRELLAGVAVVCAVDAIAGCSDSVLHSGGATSTLSRAPTGSPHPDDVRTGVYLAGLEAFALNAYGHLIELVNVGKISAPSAAMTTVINAASAHHGVHLDAWNAFLVTAGHPGVREPESRIMSALGAVIQKAISVGVGDAAVSLEQLLASNYVTATPTLASAAATRLAASVLVVEWEHAAVALYLLKHPPLPEAYASDALSQ